MWPKLTNINSTITDNIKSKSDNLKSSELNAWIRVFSGATSSKSNGLIISSGNSYNILKASGQASIYGDSNATGVVGTTWDGYPIEANDRGLRPSVLVTGFNVKEGKDQISREATLQLKCFSLQQMELVQKYFMEPGYSLCIEWGWNTAPAVLQIIQTRGNDGKAKSVNEILNQASERNLDYEQLKGKRLKSKGDYDSFLGFIIGGTVSNDGETFNVDVKLRGAPGLPTYLQSQFEVKDLSSNDDGSKTTPDTIKKPYGPDEVGAAGNSVDIARKRRFKSMFNELATVRQTPDVKKFIGKVKYTDFINFDYYAAQQLVEFVKKKTWFGLGGPASTTVNGVEIKNEEALSNEKFIKFGLAVDILNTNGALEEYVIGNKKVSVSIDISKAKIGAFPNMFSTDATKLIIPNSQAPDFKQYFINSGDIVQKTNGILEVNGVTKPTTNNIIGGVSFVENTKALNEDGLAEDAGYWGYLKNLYININILNQALNQRNINKREALVYMLNQMSSAANSFWNFQVVESQPNGESNIIISVIDENWIGKHSDKAGMVTFDHSGPNSPFLSSNLDINIPSEMANQIIGERLGKAVNPDQKILNVGGKTSFFDSSTDLFLTKVTDTGTGNGDKVGENGEGDTEEQIANIVADKKAKEKEINDKIDKTKTKTSSYGSKGSSSTTTTYYDSAGNELYSTSTTYTGGGSAYSYTSYAGNYKAEMGEFDKKLQALGTNSKEQDQKADEAEKAAYSENIKKLALLPKPAICDIIKLDEINKQTLQSEDYFRKYIGAYTFNDPSYFDKLKNDSFRKNRPGTLSHPLPIKYSFTIKGNSGLQRGDTFNIIGIPSKYALRGLFQITQVEHTLDGMDWKSTVTGEYRCNN